MMRLNKCPCCDELKFEKIYNNTKLQPLKNSRDFLYGSYRYINDLHECGNCGYRFIDSIAENYLNYYVEQNSLENSSQDKFRIAYFEKIKSEVEFFIAREEPKIKILDIGCSNGLWLKLWSKKAFLYGTEVSADHIGTLKKSNIKVTDLDNDLENYDMISLFDVLEHVENPYCFLQNIKKRIKPGGIIVIGVPNMATLPAKLLKEKYYLVCPMHFSYFNEEALRRLLNRVFGNDINVQKSPIMHTDLRGIARWLTPNLTVPENINFRVPIPYRASLIAYVKV
jgi:2-polyprenyl-3-methyl-5-hydroxy-6-metoxy-1,4-benzoquinol methylase